MPRDPSNLDPEADPLLGPAPGGPPSGGPLRLRFTRFESGKPLSKEFFRRPDGSIGKTPNANLTHGVAETRTVSSLEELGRHLAQFNDHQAVTWGITDRIGRVYVTTAKNRVNGEIARTREFFAWPSGHGVLMVDIDAPKQDDGGMPFPTGERAVEVLRNMHPVFAAVRILWCPSPSSGVDGAGIKGQRLYVPVADARLIEFVKPVLDDLQWVAGYGRFDVADDGGLLNRGFFDTSVWQPERLDFVGRPVLGEGITRDSIPWFVSPGSKQVADLSGLLLDHTDELKAQANERRRQARAAKAEEAAAKRAAARVTRPYLNPNPLTERETLVAAHELITRDGQSVTVADLLADPQRWHRAEFHDPMDPDYNDDPRIAVAFLTDGQPKIVSHAHGTRTYYLQADLSAVFDEIEQEPEDRPRPTPPLWLDTQRAVQAAANAREFWRGENTIEVATIRLALGMANVLTIHSLVASGKTEELARLAVNILLSGRTDTLLILLTSTTDARGDLRDRVFAILEREQGREADPEQKQSVEVLVSGVASRPIRDPKTGAAKYRILIGTHGVLTPRGDDPTAEGRLLQMLDALRETEVNLGLPALETDFFADEGDALIARLVRHYALAYRMRTVIDPNTKEPRERMTGVCSRDCSNCRYVPNEVHVATYGTRSGVHVLKVAPNPGDGMVKVDTGRICDAVADDAVFCSGTEIRLINPAKLPVGEPLNSLELGDPEKGEKDWLRPNPIGMLADLAAAPWATVRRVWPRDRQTLEPIRPEETEGRDVLWPSRPCEVPHLVSWDARPLERLKRLLSPGGGRAGFLSGTWSRDSLTLVHNLFEGQDHATIDPDEDRKMNGLLVVTVPSLAVEEKSIRSFVDVAPTFCVLPKVRDVREKRDIVKSWRDRNLTPAVWIDGDGQWDLTRLPTFVLAYRNASISRGANLGRLRIAMLFNSMQSALIDTLGASERLEDIPIAVEENRRASMVQIGGRTKRAEESIKGSRVDDGRLRADVYEGYENPITGEWVDDAAWYVERMKPLVRNENVQHLVLKAFPARASEAVRQFLAGETVTVTDAPAPGVTADKLSPRQRALTKDVRAAARENARKVKAEAKLWALAAEPRRVTWSSARKAAKLDRCAFTPEEVENLKNLYHARIKET